MYGGKTGVVPPSDRLLVLDLPLLGGIHLLPILSLQKYRLDLTIEEFPGLRVPGIQAMVVDEDGLVLEPFCPAILADLLQDPFSNGIPERGLLEFGGVFIAATTAKRIH
jgi:hypothetical protein